MKREKAGEEAERHNVENKVENYGVYIVRVNASTGEGLKGSVMKVQDKSLEYRVPEGKTKQCKTKCNSNCMLLGNVA